MGHQARIVGYCRARVGAFGVAVMDRMADVFVVLNVSALDVVFSFLL
jgi:hypothetical protein